MVSDCAVIYAALFFAGHVQQRGENNRGVR